MVLYNHKLILSGSTWDFSKANVATLTLTGDQSLSVANTSDMDVGILKVLQDGTGGHVLTVAGLIPDDWEIKPEPDTPTIVSFMNIGGTIHWSMVAQYTIEEGATTTTSTSTTTSSTTTTTTTGGGGGSLDADAQTYVDALVAQGVTPSGTEEGFINDFILEMKSAGVWAKRVAYYFPIWEDANANLINMRNPGTHNLVLTGGSWTHGPNGMVGGALTGYIPSTHFAQDDINISCYVNGATVNTFESPFGCQDGSFTLGMYWVASATLGGGCNTAEVTIGSDAESEGYYGMNRIVSTDYKITKNGVAVINNTDDSSGLPTTAQLCFGLMKNHFGSGLYPLTPPWAFGAVGQGLTQTEYEDENTSVQALITNFGV